MFFQIYLDGGPVGAIGFVANTGVDENCPALDQLTVASMNVTENMQAQVL